MSEAVSAMNHARHEGLALVQEVGLQGMITLRGELSSRAFRAAATGAGGVRMPAPGRAEISGDSGLCWMSPDELLLLCPYDEVAERLQMLTDRLGSSHALAVDVSDARAVFRVSGAPAREVLAKLCPVDLSPAAFTPGMFRRTRMAQVPAAFRVDADGAFHIICFRSVAEYVFGLLQAAAQPGSGVGVFQA